MKFVSRISAALLMLLFTQSLTFAQESGSVLGASTTVEGSVASSTSSGAVLGATGSNLIVIGLIAFAVISIILTSVTRREKEA